MQGAFRKGVKRFAIAVPIFVGAFYFIPYVTLAYIGLGVIDVMRNDIKNSDLFRQYFMGKGMFMWLLSPLNLLADLLSFRNRKIWRREDFPEDYRREIDSMLSVFDAKRDQITAEIDDAFKDGRRGMYIYQWYGVRHIQSVPEFAREYKYIRTIAVSVFNGRESTSFHFGPLRLTLRLLYNLSPVESEDVFIECGNTKHYWHEKPLFIFDDTLLHRSVNEYDGRRYCVFVDIIRPSPFPRLLSALVHVVSIVARPVNSVFYKHWQMIRRPANATAAPSSYAG